MITPSEADALAEKVINEYLSACGPKTREDAGNALMKLASMCGLCMCAIVGKEDAVDRLNGTVERISRAQDGVNWAVKSNASRTN